MTVRLSTGMRNALLLGGSSGGVSGALTNGFLYLYDGTQPASPDTGASGTLLGKVTISHDGSTGLQFEAPASGVMTKDTDEVWQFIGLAAGNVGWFRFSEAADTPTADSATAKRIDGLVGTAGADANITNTAVAVDAVSTVDAWSFTMPASL